MRLPDENYFRFFVSDLVDIRRVVKRSVKIQCTLLIPHAPCTIRSGDLVRSKSRHLVDESVDNKCRNTRSFEIRRAFAEIRNDTAAPLAVP